MHGINARLLGLLALLLPLWVMAGDGVWFLFEESNDYHRQYIEESSALLRKAMPGVEIRHITLSDAGALPTVTGNTPLLITVGSAAAQRAVVSNLPTLNTMITRRTFGTLRDKYPGPVSAIYLEQPVSRQLQLIRIALPEHHAVTVLLGPGSDGEARELALESRALGLELRVIAVDEEGAIEKLFGRELLSHDTLLLLPDPIVVNRSTVKPLVLGSFRQGVPLVGYSQALVKAGALMAVHSNLPLLESEAVEAVKVFFSRGELPAPRYATGMDVSVNYQLARALKITLPSELSLTQRLKELQP